MQGYFYAPVTGQYIFRGSADDNFGLYISDDFGSATVNASPHIYDSSHASNADNYYVRNSSTALGTGVSFEAGKYYYMKMYFVNSGS